MKRSAGQHPLLQRLFAIDLRSLAAFRICLGLLLLADLALRAMSLEQHYSDNGLLPRADYLRLFLQSPWHWSLHELSGTTTAMMALFSLAGVAALAMTLGYRTRLFTIISWSLLASLHARNPMLQYGADHLLRMLLLWSIFLPLGARWSLDQGRLGVIRSGQYLSAATAAILAQMFLVYAFSGVFKMNDHWFGGHALETSLSMDMFAKPMADTLLENPWLINLGSHAIPWLELCCALLLFAPWATLHFRMLALVLLASFHLSAEVLLETGMFQFVALSALLLFLPSSIWDQLTRIIKTCVSRSRSVQITELRVEHSSAHRETTDTTPGSSLLNDAVQTVVALLLIYVIVWNAFTLSARQYTRQNSLDWLSQSGTRKINYQFFLPGYAVERRFGQFGWLGRAAMLHQQWNMFEQGGGSTDGWHVVIGTLEDGEEISLLEQGRPYTRPRHPRPDNPAGLYRDTRWRVCFRYMNQAARAHPLLAVALWRDWNQRHPKQTIQALEILHIQEPALRDGEELQERETTWFNGSVISPGVPDARTR